MREASEKLRALHRRWYEEGTPVGLAPIWPALIAMVAAVEDLDARYLSEDPAHLEDEIFAARYRALDALTDLEKALEVVDA